MGLHSIATLVFDASATLRTGSIPIPDTWARHHCLTVRTLHVHTSRSFFAVPPVVRQHDSFTIRTMPDPHQSSPAVDAFIHVHPPAVLTTAVAIRWKSSSNHNTRTLHFLIRSTPSCMLYATATTRKRHLYSSNPCLCSSRPCFETTN